MDTTGVLHGADKNGEPATENDPFIETCTDGSIAENERCTIGSLRTLHGAEMTYASTYGIGSYSSSLAELVSIGFIHTILERGSFAGIRFPYRSISSNADRSRCFQYQRNAAKIWNDRHQVVLYRY